MAITAMKSTLKTQIANAFKMERSASQDKVAAVITGAISSIAPAGLFPAGITMIPLVPSGASTCKSQMKNAFSLDRSATPNKVAQIMAIAISVLCPIVPPAGLSICKTQIASAFKMERSAKPDSVAKIISQAIISYFTAGGVI